jgi:flavodoxin
MKILIAFYSWTGHTETLAQALGKKLGADVVRIEPLEDPGKKIGKEGMKALFGQREAIKPVQVDLAGIDHLVIATPVWIASVPPYTREYLVNIINCKGKKFSVLAEMGGRGGKRVVRKVRKVLEKKDMTFVASVQTIEKEVEAGNFDKILEEFVKKVQTG